MDEQSPAQSEHPRRASTGHAALPSGRRRALTFVMLVLAALLGQGSAPHLAAVASTPHPPAQQISVDLTQQAPVCLKYKGKGCTKIAKPNNGGCDPTSQSCLPNDNGCNPSLASCAGPTADPAAGLHVRASSTTTDPSRVLLASTPGAAVPSSP